MNYYKRIIKRAIDGIRHPLAKPSDGRSHEYYCDNTECQPQKVNKLTYFCNRHSIFVLQLLIIQEPKDDKQKIWI